MTRPKRVSETGDQAFDMVLGLKDVDEMFDLVCVGNYMRGRLDGMMPVDESRAVFEKIKKLLAKPSNPCPKHKEIDLDCDRCNPDA